MINYLQNILKIFNSIKYKKKFYFISFIVSILGLLEVVALYALYLILVYFIEPGSKIESSFFYKAVKKIGITELEANNYLQFLIILVFLIYFIKFFFSILTYYLQFSFSENVRIKIYKMLLNTYMHKEYSYHVETNFSELIRNMSIEIGNFCTGVVQQLLTIITELTLLFFIVLFLFFFNSKIVMFAFIFLFPLFILYSHLSKSYFFKYGQLRHDLFAKVLKSLIEPIQSIQEIKIYGATDYFVNKNIFLNKQISKVQILLNMLSSTPRIVIEFLLISIFLVIIFFYNLNENFEKDNLSILGMFAIAALRLMPSMSKIMNAGNLMKTNLPSVKTILKEVNNYNFEKKIFLEDFSFKKEISVENIFFKYKHMDKIIFSNLSLKIKKKKLIAITGKSGTGKSTLVNLLNGLIKPENGTIKVDNVNIHLNDNMYKWQKNISYVPQKIFLMDETIKNNIAFDLNDNEIDMELMIKSAKIAEIYDFIESLPEKFNTKVGQLGSKISGGQIQRLGIARAIYKNRKLLILDEATNSLDEQTEIKILENLKKTTNQLTVLLISHNKNVLKLCDELINLDAK